MEALCHHNIHSSITENTAEKPARGRYIRVDGICNLCGALFGTRIFVGSDKEGPQIIEEIKHIWAEMAAKGDSKVTWVSLETLREMVSPMNSEESYD